MKMLILAVLLVAGSAEARLGESNEEIFKRYGAVTRRDAVNTNEWTGFYEFNGYNVAVTFSNNVSVVETFSPIIKRTVPADEIDRLKKLIGGESDCVAQTTTVNGLQLVRVGNRSYLESVKKASQVERKRELERKTDGF